MGSASIGASARKGQKRARFRQKGVSGGRGISGSVSGTPASDSPWFDRFRFNSADFLKLGISNAFVIDEPNRNLRWEHKAACKQYQPQ
jgi:hypothetical protein